MIKWYKTSNNKWKVLYEENCKEINSLQKLILFSNLYLEIDMNDIEAALLALEMNEHNYCEFGILKRFVFSKRMET